MPGTALNLLEEHGTLEGNYLMRKKMLSTCLSLVALTAFAVIPAAASATKNIVVKENGVNLPVGTKLLATTPTLTMGGEAPSTVLYHCKGEMTGTVVKNDTVNGSAGTITSANFFNTTGTTGSHCASNTFGATLGITTEGLPWCLTSVTNADQVKLEGGDCNGVASNLKFTMHLTIFGAPAGTCTYSAASALGNVTLETGKITAVPASTTFSKEGKCTTETAEANLPTTTTMQGEFTVTTDDAAETAVKLET
jgi:hypothetical protein